MVKMKAKVTKKVTGKATSARTGRPRGPKTTVVAIRFLTEIVEDLEAIIAETEDPDNLPTAGQWIKEVVTNHVREIRS